MEVYGSFVWWRSCLCFPGSWLGLFLLWWNSFFPDTLSQRSFSFVKSKFWDSQLLEDEGKLQSAGFQHGGFSSSSRSFSAATKWPCPSVLSVGRCRVDHGRFWRESRMWSLMHGKRRNWRRRKVNRKNQLKRGDVSWNEEVWKIEKSAVKTICVKVYSVQRWIKNLNRTFRLLDL